MSVLYNDSVRTAQKKLSTSVTHSLLMLSKVKVHTEHLNAMWAPCRVFEC